MHDPNVPMFNGVSNASMVGWYSDASLDTTATIVQYYGDSKNSRSVVRIRRFVLRFDETGKYFWDKQSEIVKLFRGLDQQEEKDKWKWNGQRLELVL